MKSISGKELCKIVEKKGWILKRINGSHHIYKKTGVENLLVIPVHKMIPQLVYRCIHLIYMSLVLYQVLSLL